MKFLIQNRKNLNVLKKFKTKEMSFLGDLQYVTVFMIVKTKTCANSKQR